MPDADQRQPSSPSAKPRRFFQIHLSTAVVLMFVAGVLVWANFHIREHRLGSLVMQETGWPHHLAIGKVEYIGPPLHDDPRNVEVCSNSDLAPLRFGVWEANVERVFRNIAVAVALMSATAFACEWSIRCLERPQP